MNRPIKPLLIRRLQVTVRFIGIALVGMYDRLEFVADSYDHKHGLSPALMLTFVESVLGYRMTYNDASSWTLRRDTAFKS